MTAPRYFTYKNQVPLAGGATLAFEPGKGYYAKPPALAMSPQPKRPPTLVQQAGTQAQSAVDAETRPIKDAQAAYDAQAAQRRQAYVELAKAAAAAMSQIGPQLQAGYGRAASELGSIASPLSEGLRSRLADEQRANADFIRSQVQGADIPQGVDPNAVKDALLYGGAVIPSQQLEAEGLAGLDWGLEQPGIALAQGTENLRNLDQTISKDDADFASQLAAVVAKYPQLRDDALAALQKHQLDVRAQALQERAQADIEKRLGITDANAKATIAERTRHDKALESAASTRNYLTQQGLKVRQANVRISQAKLNSIDSSASRVAGYLVDRAGHPILSSNGQRIPVTRTSSASSSYQRAVIEAGKLAGKPSTNPDVGPASPGRYLAAPGATGSDVYPARAGFPATTSNAAKAQSTRTMSFLTALRYLQDAYGISKTQARKALIAAGWRPGT